MTPQNVIAEVTASGIQGRGGAAFPMGRKWAVMQPNDGQPHYLCANADEGEPGTFKDRWILEFAPHLLLESMLIASYALQVRNAFVYIRGEFDGPYRRLAGALEEAYDAGYFGTGILGTDFACDLVVYRGAGSYVCGEASALITSIEGKRGYPRNRPPRLTVRGLYQKPTVINNVETLSNIAWIIANGGEAFKKIGHAKDPGTRLISISGHIARPGVYEIECGYPFAKFIHRGLRRRHRRAADQGDHSRRHFDQGADGKEIEPLTLDNPFARGSGLVDGLGRHGRRSPRARAWCACCKCCCASITTSRAASARRAAKAWDGCTGSSTASSPARAARGHRASLPDLAWNDGTTICGMGDAAGYATSGILNKFRDEFEYFIEHEVAPRRSAGMPEFFINGSRPRRARPERARGGARQRLLHPVLLLASRALVAGNCRDLLRAGRGTKLGRDRLQHAGHRGLARAHRFGSR
jgi:NADH-quinone oxidoreductase subunit F